VFAQGHERGVIEKNRTWELVKQLPRSQKAIGLKWVYKVKRDKKGAIVKHKALLVAKGYVQQEVDFEEVFAPVACLDSLCLLLVIAAVRHIVYRSNLV
jgi:hypothetical protein